MKLIVENSSEEIARHHAEDDLERSLQALAANLLRVLRGAGKPGAITDQLVRVLQAMQRYRDATGQGPPADLVAGILRLPEPDWLDQLGQVELQRYLAKRQVVRGALQTVASELLEQLTQQRAGEHEIYAGVNELMRVRQEQSRERQRPLSEIALERAKARAEASQKPKTKPKS